MNQFVKSSDSYLMTLMSSYFAAELIDFIGNNVSLKLREIISTGSFIEKKLLFIKKLGNLVNTEYSLNIHFHRKTPTTGS